MSVPHLSGEAAADGSISEFSDPDFSATVVFSDQNTPKSEPASCYLTWAVGLSPPSNYVRGACSDASVNAWFPSGTYNGVEDFQLEIAHTYLDSR